jgi:hypothetical protein
LKTDGIRAGHPAQSDPNPAAGAVDVTEIKEEPVTAIKAVQRLPAIAGLGT